MSYFLRSNVNINFSSKLVKNLVYFSHIIHKTMQQMKIFDCTQYMIHYDPCSDLKNFISRLRVRQNSKSIKKWKWLEKIDLHPYNLVQFYKIFGFFTFLSKWSLLSFSLTWERRGEKEFLSPRSFPLTYRVMRWICICDTQFSKCRTNEAAKA